MARTDIIKAIFAVNGITTIPATPIVGETYRDSTITDATIQDGWPYNEIVKSEDFNQIMYDLHQVVKELDEKGSLEWSNLIAYEVGAIVRGTDSVLYLCIQNSAAGVNDPSNGGAPNYWTIFTASPSNRDFYKEYGTSAADVYVITKESPVIANGIYEGTPFTFISQFANTTNSTLKIVDGSGTELLPAQAIVNVDGTNLSAGTIQVGAYLTVRYDLVNTRWVLVEVISGIGGSLNHNDLNNIQGGNLPTEAYHATLEQLTKLANLTGSPLRIDFTTTSQTLVAPTGAIAKLIIAYGPGGGGSDSQADSNDGGGGGGGAMVIQFVLNGDNITVVIGLGGLGATVNNTGGTDGGTTTVTGTDVNITALGGKGANTAGAAECKGGVGGAAISPTGFAIKGDDGGTASTVNGGNGGGPSGGVGGASDISGSPTGDGGDGGLASGGGGNGEASTSNGGNGGNGYTITVWFGIAA